MTTIEQRELLDVLHERAPKALHVAEIAARLGLPKQERDRVRDALDLLVEDGFAAEMPGSRYRIAKKQLPSQSDSMHGGAKHDAGAKRAGRPLPAHVVTPRTASGSRGRSHAAAAAPFRDSTPPPRGARPSYAPPTLVRGVLTVHPRGFGFVAADDGGPDVFVPDSLLGPGLHGDRVEVDARPSAKGREGAVTGILSRRDPRITGSLRGDRGSWFFLPDDPRLRGPMRVTGEVPSSLREGDVVVSKIVGFPQSLDDRATVTVEAHLGIAGLTTVEVTKIKIREGVVEDFPPGVIAEARSVPTTVSADEIVGRVDLRDVELVTIDPDDARDHDDALYGERTPRGFHLVIAIADVSHYVREGTAIDAEATTRCTSIYLPDRAIPMLPPEISSNIASLVPNKDRLCLAVEVELTSSGNIESYRLVEGVMRSRARLTYSGAARALGLTDAGPKQRDADKHLASLKALLDASRVLRKKRLARGALDFNLPEAKVKLDPTTGEPVDVERSRKDPGVREAYRLVEEMMLLANEVVAADLTERGVPAIYRVHGRPDERKIALFCELARSLGHDLDPDDASDPKVLAQFLQHVEESPEAPVLRYLLLRSMQQAAYDVNPNVGHFGLAARDYLHFTSPIRRYPDLAVHRVVRSVLRREQIDGAMLFPRLRMMASESSRLERRAMSVERDVVKLYATILMRDRVGDVIDASISSVESHGFHVSLDAPFVECWVPLEELSGDRYELDDLGLRLTSWSGHSYGLGDRIRVRIVRVSLDRREVTAVPDLETAEETPRRTRRGRRAGEEAEPQVAAAAPARRGRHGVEEAPARGGRPTEAPPARRGRHVEEGPARAPRHAEEGPARAARHAETEERTVRRGRHADDDRGTRGARAAGSPPSKRGGRPAEPAPSRGPAKRGDSKAGHGGARGSKSAARPGKAKNTKSRK